MSAIQPKPDAIFPLPLAPFEYYYLQDDRPEYPTSFPVVLRFQGRLNRQAFTQALHLVVARHPLLTAVLSRSESGWPQWIAGPEIQLAWRREPGKATSSGWLAPLAPESIDLWREAGFRAAVYELSEATELRLQIHHACCDGVGTQIVVRDLLLAYDHIASQREGEPALPPVDSQRLLRRDEFGMAEYRATLRDVWNMLLFWGNLLWRPAAVVAQRQDAAARPGAAAGFGPCYAAVGIDPVETAGLASRAKSQGITVNDLILRDFFLTLDDWNQAATKQPRGHLRILVPTNLRLEDDLAMPAANVLGFAFLTRRRKAMADPAGLLKGIHDEMAAIKKWRLGLYFVAGVRIACGWPGLLRWSLHRNHAFATAVFSNMSVVFHNLGFPQRNGHAVVGGSELVWIASVPPIRPGTRAALAAVTYGGMLHLHLQCDERHLSRDDAEALLDGLLRRLKAE